MTERLSTATLPAPGEAPADTPVDAESHTTAEVLPPPGSPEARQHARERVDKFLLNDLHEQALKENARFDQDAAYATYAENIAASTPPEAPNAGEPTPSPTAPETQNTNERKGRVRSFFSKVTNAALVRLEAGGYIPLRSQWQQSRGLAGLWLRRRAAAQKRRSKRAVGFSSASETASLGLDQGSTPDAPSPNPNSPADTGSSTPEATTSSPEKTSREKARERAEAALERRRQRREGQPTFRERTTEHLKGAANSKIGQSALRFFKRVNVATRSAVSSARGNSAR